MRMMVPPGQYTVRLTIGEAVLEEELTVLKDPNSLGTEANIAAQNEIVRDLSAMLDDAAELINEIEGVRVQLDNLGARLGSLDVDDRDGLQAAAADVNALVKDIEGELFDLRHTGTGQDGLRWRRLLYARLGSLARGIMSSDARPTDQQVAVFVVLRDQWEALDARFENEAVPAIRRLNEDLETAGIPNVFGGRARPIP